MRTLGARKTTVSISALALAFSALNAVASPAQAATKGQITGTVLDSSGTPMMAVEVALWRKTKGVWENKYEPVGTPTVTDKEGHYTIRARSGNYVVEIVPTRNQMFRQYYYATVAGRLAMSTNDYQPKPGSFLIYFAFPGDGDSAPTHKITDGHTTNLGASRLRQGAMIRGTVKCPTLKRQSGLVFTNFPGTWFADPLDIHRDGTFRTKTPRPAGKVSLVYNTERCPYKRTVVRQSLKKAALNTLVPVTKRPVRAIKRPHVSGVSKVGRALTAHLGTWPRGTTKSVYWQRYRYFGTWVRYQKDISGPTLRLKPAYRGDKVRAIVKARKPGHFDATVRLDFHHVR